MILTKQFNELTIEFSLACTFYEIGRQGILEEEEDPEPPIGRQLLIGSAITSRLPNYNRMRFLI
jgi:hypothetical protein